MSSKRAQQAKSAELEPLEFLELLVEDELTRRANRLLARRLKRAGITAIEQFSDFDWSINPKKIPRRALCDLATARLVVEHHNVLLIGPHGVGKSFAAVAISVGAIRAGYRALLRSVFALAQDFAEADATRERRQLVQQLVRCDLLVLEDFGMKRPGPYVAEDLLEIFVRRHETASTIVTTNRPTQDWGSCLRTYRRHGNPRSIPRSRRDHQDAGQELQLHHRAKRESKKQEEK